MRLIAIVILSAVMALPAGAVSKRKQCRQACSALSAACAEQTAAAGFGNLAKACKEAVQRRCLTEGPSVCATFCGNGSREREEACDAADLSGATCVSLGFASGTLACTTGCQFDTSGCRPFAAPTCGNGAIDPPEQCDGAALGGATCASVGFAAGGTLTCTAGCAFDTHACRPSELPTCGNGVVNGSEQCDGAALGGATCTSLGYSLGGTLGCTAGCAFDTHGCASQRFTKTGQIVTYGADTHDGIPGVVMVPDDGTLEVGQPQNYVDNGDGTITDMNTGLMWEAKNDTDAGLHDKDNVYPWSGDGIQETIWDWLQDVNAELGSGFAGHSDWRIPNVKELESLVVYSPAIPTVDPAFDDQCRAGCMACSCTRSFSYWSSSTDASNTMQAWTVAFGGGNVDPMNKASMLAVRAVRTARSAPSCGVSDKCVFVTGGVSTSNLGGLSGADATCRAVAGSAGLPGTYVAWLSDSTTNAITRVTSNGPFATPDGDVVASSLVDLTDGSLNAPIEKNEYGTAVPLREVWTGTNATGERDGSSCCNWTGCADSAWVGLNTHADSGWSEAFLQFCDRNISLYCVQE